MGDDQRKVPAHLAAYPWIFLLPFAFAPQQPEQEPEQIKKDDELYIVVVVGRILHAQILETQRRSRSEGQVDGQHTAQHIEPKEPAFVPPIHSRCFVCFSNRFRCASLQPELHSDRSIPEKGLGTCAA